MKALRSLLSSSLIALALVATGARAADESPWKFEFHGIFGGSLYVQDQRFNGEGEGTYLTQRFHPGRDVLIQGADTRQTKLTFQMTGPQVLGATPRAYLEYDLFGGANSGNYTESDLTRLRVAFVELAWNGRTYVQVGQQNHLILNQVPATVGHIGAPLILDAGYLGWRTPGVTAFHKIPVGDMTWEVAGQISRLNWNDATCSGAFGAANTAPGGVCLGRAGSFNYQARAKVDGKAGGLTYTAYLAGAYGEIDASGWNAQLAPTATGKDTFQYTAGVIGAKFVYNPVTLAFNYYNGTNTSADRGFMEQFPTIGANGLLHDIGDQAVWAQIGVAIPGFPKWSVWYLYATDMPNKSDLEKAYAAATTIATLNTNQSVMVKYTEGALNLGFEYYNGATEYTGIGGGQRLTSDVAHGQQYMVSAAYIF